MMNLQCIIFDMDGTLTRTNQLIFDSFNHIVRKYTGRVMKDEEITALFGPPEEGAIVQIVGEEHLEEAMKEYLTFYRENHHRLAKLYPGIRDVLDDIRRRNTRLALFTGKGTHTTQITLEEFGLTPYFELVVTGNDVVEHKPSSEGIRKILDHFSLRPAEALMVGDSVADVNASHEAGVKIAAVLWDSYGRDRVLAMNTDYLFHHVEEFHRWLNDHLP